MTKIGVLITNTGTPDAPTKTAVRRYLKEFLSDKRIVQLPRLIWLPILYGLILTLRPKRSAKLYQAIWDQNDSPMRTIMQKIISRLQMTLKTMDRDTEDSIEIAMAMNYGQPNISTVLKQWQQQGMDNIIILPLFPQYSNTTTASSFDRVMSGLQKWPAFPQIHFIRDYATHPKYIAALAQTIRTAWEKRPPAQHLLISFHGIPKRFVKKGDPYQKQCEQTAELLAKALALPKERWTLCYQSKFGYDEWLQPSTQTLFTTLPEQGMKTIDIICPGFAVDCLETLEEIRLSGKELFLHAGGTALHYIPALNDAESQIDLLTDLIFETV